MKHITAALTLLLFVMASHAEIYKGTDDEGNIIYSDKELPNSELVPEPSPNTIMMPKPEPRQPVTNEEKPTGAYTSFAISSPGNDATIQVASGDVQVTLSVTPALAINQGHRISIYINGAPTLSTTRLSLQVPNVSRGSHTLSAEIRDKNNKVLKKSNTVTFHVKRHSIQHKNPSGASVGPRKPDGTPYTSGPQNVIFKPGPIIMQPPS